MSPKTFKNTNTCNRKYVFKASILNDLTLQNRYIKADKSSTISLSAPFGSGHMLFFVGMQSLAYCQKEVHAVFL